VSGKHHTGINVGGSSILVIFVLLCLTTFATLSMVSASADYKLTQKTVLAATSYYNADAAAEAILAQIDGVLLEGAKSGENYLPMVEAGLRQIEDVDYRQDGAGSPVVSYLVPLNDFQSLSVELALSPSPAVGNGKRFSITQWKVLNTAPLVMEDEGIEGLWTGEIISG